MRAVNPEQSKLALAVSPQDVRRTSNVAMRAVRPAPPVPSANLGTRSDGYRPVSTLDSSKSKRLGIPIVLAVVGILVALAYYVNASMGGGRWALGPAPVNWIAGLLTVAGTGMILVRLFWPEE